MSTCIFGIKLSTTTSEDKETSDYAGQYLEIDAASPVNLVDAGIFVYSRQPRMPEDGVWESTFEAVATPNDLNELPFGEPLDTDTTTKLFRLNYINVYLHSRTELTATVDLVQADVNVLLKGLAMKCEHLADPIVTTYNTSDPVATSDTNAGYSVGDKWLNVVTGVTWTCVTNTVNTATWST